MTDKELADAVVVCGVGERHGDFYSLDGRPSSQLAPKSYVRDWCVAGAFIDRLWSLQVIETTTDGSYVVAKRGGKFGYGEQPKGERCRAIIEAGVQAFTVYEDSQK